MNEINDNDNNTLKGCCCHFIVQFSYTIYMYVYVFVRWKTDGDQSTIQLLMGEGVT